KKQAHQEKIPSPRTQVAHVIQERHFQQLPDGNPQLRGEGDEWIASAARAARLRDPRLRGARRVLQSEHALALADRVAQLLAHVLRLDGILVEAAKGGGAAQVEAAIARRVRVRVELVDAPGAGGEHEAGEE